MKLRKYALLGVICLFLLSITACSSGDEKKKKEALSVGKYFECLEDTLKQDSFEFELSDLFDESCYYKITKCTYEDNTYVGYYDDRLSGSAREFYKYAYYKDNELYELGYDSVIDVTNKYDEGGGLSSEYVIYRLMKAFESENINDVMDSVGLYESAEGMLAFRTYKQGIEKVISLYNEDKSNISFIKDLSMSDDEFKIEMYVGDFYIWCENNLDSVIISDDQKESFIGTEASKITVTISIKLDGDYVSEYKHIYGPDLQAGMEMYFNNINQLGEDSPLVLSALDRDKYEQAVFEAKRESSIQWVKDMYEESADYRYKCDYPCGTIYSNKDKGSKMVYDIGVYGYAFESYGWFDSEEFAKSYSADDMISYLEKLEYSDVLEAEEASAWKQTYFDYFNEIYDDGYYRWSDSFDLVDINEDGIPEICYRYSQGTFEEGLIYINKQNEVKEIETDIPFLASYYDKCIWFSNPFHEYVMYEVYNYDNETGEYVKSAHKQEFDSYEQEFDSVTEGCKLADVNTSKYDADKILTIISEY